MKYRSDIDGLRAVAILPVVLCHLGLASFAGGFVGVDVFFVISGYLISRILLEEVQEGRFSLFGFYERRIRRIFPALFAMLAASFLAASFLLMPEEMMGFGASLLSTVFSYSNFHFNVRDDYFAAASTTKPLLHTWSLAVEEQFYVAFPLLLLVWKRWFANRKVLLALLLAIFIGSLIFAAIGANTRETWAFYLPHARAWELLAGTFLAMGILPNIRWAWLRHGLSLLGLGLIAYAVASFDATTKFPGLNALYPVLGTALIIYAGQGAPSLIGRVLSWKPFVAIGLVSYSWYLWHWPIIVFYRTTYHPALWPLAPYEVPLLFSVSLLVGWLSWKFIEQPFRTRAGHVHFPRKKLFILSGVAVCFFAGIVGGIWQTKGLPQRFPKELMEQYAKDRKGYTTRECVYNHRRITRFDDGSEHAVSAEKIDACVTEEPGKRNVLVFGDSHAAAYYKGLKDAFPESHFSLVAVTSCREWDVAAPSHEVCKGVLYHVLNDVLPKHKGMTVVLLGNWHNPRDMEIVHNVRVALEAQGHPAIVLGTIGFYTDPLPKLRFYASLFGQPQLPEHYWDAKPALVQEFATYNTRFGDDYVLAYDVICPEGKCIAETPEGRTIFYDKHHFNDSGADYFGKLLRESGRLKLQ